jgi:hypothetical protein
MKVLTYGEIMDTGSTVFHSVARLDGEHLFITFEGIVRIDNPYRYLAPYLEELRRVLPTLPIARITLDFTELRFCNSNGFYVIMDIVEVAYRCGSASSQLPAPVSVRRLQGDDWQQETLPILLNADEDEIARRTTYEDVQDIG